MGQAMCNCNSKGDNNEEYLFDEKYENTNLINDITINDCLSKIQFISLLNVPKKERIIKNIYLVNIIKKIQNSFRIFRIFKTLKKNMSHVNLVNY